jgi:hypothetical protein
VNLCKDKQIGFLSPDTERNNTERNKEGRRKEKRAGKREKRSSGTPHKDPRLWHSEGRIMTKDYSLRSLNK